MAAAYDSPDVNTIEVGWVVAPSRGSTLPTLFTYWTSDGYKSTGCYNLECPGFVQTYHGTALDGALANISVYGGIQFDITYDVRKDRSTQNWWLSLNGIAVGYWPASIFTRMSESADVLVWGGEVYDKVAPGDNTPTQMGSGHFSRESYMKASYIRDIKYIDTSGNDVVLGASELAPLITESSCFDLNIEQRDQVYVFYGGPGCRK
ncbi:hypothetical protein RND81_02G086900 [Saponaria officinalis]|uniref:Neprosin PEP catalytic domain-containing protein n=1 Tax=Saponaria officinalis TaxID=3572 RepID=A0AAW1MKT8_SAPOF